MYTNGIDVQKRHLFIEDDLSKKSIDKLYDYVRNKLDIKNVAYEDVYDELVEELITDYDKRICNCESYLRPHTDLRVLLELRKSAMLNLNLPDSFYTEHKNLNTVKEIKAHRVKYLRPMFEDYDDVDWQYSVALRFSTTLEQQADLCFDFEYWFADGDPDHVWPDYWEQTMEKYFAYDINTGKRKPNNEYGVYNRDRRWLEKTLPVDQIDPKTWQALVEFTERLLDDDTDF